MHMSNNSKTTTLALLAVIALAAATGGFWLASQNRGAVEAVPNQALMRDGPLLAFPEGKALSDFALYDHNGETFSNDSLQGDFRLAFVGFTSCPHICPNVLFKLQTVVDLLEEQIDAKHLPKVLLISVDPERDTPEKLSEYRERFDNNIEAVSGEDEQLRQLATDLGAHYVVPEHEPGEWYNVDHSLGVHVLDPDGNWVALLSAPHDPAAMAEALSRFLNQSRS